MAALAPHALQLASQALFQVRWVVVLLLVLLLLLLLLLLPCMSLRSPAQRLSACRTSTQRPPHANPRVTALLAALCRAVSPIGSCAGMQPAC